MNTDITLGKLFSLLDYVAVIHTVTRLTLKVLVATIDALGHFETG